MEKMVWSLGEDDGGEYSIWVMDKEGHSAQVCNNGEGCILNIVPWDGYPEEGGERVGVGSNHDGEFGVQGKGM